LAAQAQQQQLLSDNELLRIAKAQADEIKMRADLEATQTRREAEDWAYDVLNRLEKNVSKVMTAIESGKREVERPTIPVKVPDVREKVRIS
jgi:hypothetical protein